MDESRIVELARRGVVAVGGADARRFLNDLVTADIERAGASGAVYGGLLTPQGKILFDFIIFADGERFLFDLPRGLVPDFVRRLGFYRLRAKVEIADLSASHQVFAAWGSETPPAIGVAARDPRLAALGFRAVAAGSAPPAGYRLVSATEYDAHRIGLGVPEGGIDYAFGEAFPHDADMDQLGGVDFAKGCYVGQEVVSRMEHRGTARRRIVTVKGTALPPAGATVTAGGRPLGVLASVADGSGLALIRLDRAKEAIDAGTALTAGETPIELAIPAWARFGWPATVAED